MSKQDKKGLVPVLRFPEFQGEGQWEGKELKDACQMQAGKFVRASDISVQRTDDVFPCYGGNGLRGYTKTYTHEGKYSLVGRQGALCGNITLVKGKFHATEHAVVACPKSGIARDWLYYKLLYLNLNQYATGQAQPGLSVDNLSKVTIQIPSTEKEQQKIADCLSSIDELVTAQNQKLEALKAHKKGLMQQLFPAKGETVPKLRFPEFRDEGEWEEKELADVCNMQAGKFIRAAEINTTKKPNLYPCYGGNGLRGFVKTFTHTGRYSLIGRQGALCGNITLGTGKFHATEHAVVTTPKEHVDTNWLFYKLTHLNLNQYATGQAQPGLSVNNLERVEVEIPKKEKEQQKIADCLSSIDDLITAQTQKIESLKFHKKGLMQQLFPAVDEVRV